jgi:hypothetical protein
VYRYASHTRIPAGITTLFTRVNGQRIALSHLATKLALSATIVMQLEHRMIDPESIPQELCRRLADILQQPVPSVQAYFAGHDPADSAHVPQKVAEQQATYSAAESTDTQQRQPFRMVVALSDELSEEQRSFWRNVIEKEQV